MAITNSVKNSGSYNAVQLLLLFLEGLFKELIGTRNVNDLTDARSLLSSDRPSSVIIYGYNLKNVTLQFMQRCKL